MPTQESGDEAGGGGLIHGDNPFLPPPHERDPVRRLRGRLAAPVTLWSAGVAATGTAGELAADTAGVAAAGRSRRAALPVSAVIVAEGEPGLILGLVDGDSELWPLLESTGRFTVSVLRWEHRALADAFAGLMPAPGGPFRLAEWTDTDWGPVPTSVQTWAGCRLMRARPFGWALAVEAELERIELGEENDPLLHRRGRYFTAPGG
ncbi:flavin reductase family protein [Actinopolymorpha sp. B11F2]|uniref:flavin reductase family protein n=1 Tax=Actinopolymorpha sp. B11F2 TaxID=3160862 RepID=UPI0032E500B3